MADHDSTDPLAAATTTTSTTGGIFSRRPSFFGGGRNKALKTAGTTHYTRPSTPPQVVSSSSSNVPSDDSNSVPLFANQYEFPPKVPSTPPRKKHTSRYSISSSVADLGTSLRRSRSASLRT